MKQTITLAGFGLLAAAAVMIEVLARRSPRLATLGTAIATLLRRRPVRLVLQACWLWLGWHLFVRVEWR